MSTDASCNCNLILMLPQRFMYMADPAQSVLDVSADAANMYACILVLVDVQSGAWQAIWTPAQDILRIPLQSSLELCSAHGMRNATPKTHDSALYIQKQIAPSSSWGGGFKAPKRRQATQVCTGAQSTQYSTCYLYMHNK